jgi:hypothetical protein
VTTPAALSFSVTTVHVYGAAAPGVAGATLSGAGSSGAGLSGGRRLVTAADRLQ